MSEHDEYYPWFMKMNNYVKKKEKIINRTEKNKDSNEKSKIHSKQ